MEVIPAAESETGLTLHPEDLKMDTFRASGPGGQHVQKSATAVRITHRPTGIAVSARPNAPSIRTANTPCASSPPNCCNGRKSGRPRNSPNSATRAANPECGNEIRSYTLHPQQQVKDHRTGMQTADADGVLTGNIDPFIASGCCEVWRNNPS